MTMTVTVIRVVCGQILLPQAFFFVGGILGVATLPHLPHLPPIPNTTMAALSASALSSRVTMRLPVRARRGIAARGTMRVSAVSGDGWKSINVTKPNIVNNLGGETTRNIDGKVRAGDGGGGGVASRGVAVDAAGACVPVAL